MGRAVRTQMNQTSSIRIFKPPEYHSHEKPYDRPNELIQSKMPKLQKSTKKRPLEESTKPVTNGLHKASSPTIIESDAPEEMEHSNSEALSSLENSYIETIQENEASPSICTEEFPTIIDVEYKKLVEEREIKFIARKHAIRDCALVIFAAFIVYISIGILCYHHWFDQWSIGESFLFIFYTMTTVGYGNLAPKSQGGRLFTIFHLLLGISLITLVASAVIEYVVLKGIQARYDRDRARIARQGKLMASTKSAQENNNHMSVKHYLDSASEDKRWIDVGIEGWKRIKDYVKHNPFGKRLYGVMPLILIVCFGAITVGLLEDDFTFIDSIYFSVVTVTTVGYGDLHPVKKSSIWITIFWLPSSLYFMSLFLSNVAQMYKRVHIAHVLRIETKLRKMNAKTEEECDTNRDGINVEENHNPTAHDSDSMDQYDTMRSYLKKVKGDILDSSTKGSDTPQDASEEHNTTRKDTEQNWRRSATSSALLFDLKKRDKDNNNESTRSQSMQNCDQKPMFSCQLRMLVQERIALIIQYEILLREGSSHLTTQRNHYEALTVTFPNMKEVAEKWLIPRRARESFAVVTLEILMTLGAHGIKSGQLFELSPIAFNRLFLPVMAAMAPVEISETWLASTEMLFDDMGWDEFDDKEESVQENFAEKIINVFGTR